MLLLLSRFFATLALGAPILWVFSLLGTLLLGVAGCAISDIQVNPCTVAGMDLSKLGYGLGLTSTLGLFLVMPIFLFSGFCWWAVRWLRNNHW